ncbi:hypothetical protein GCM10009635_44340 [Actinocatenispora thailandica]
MLGRWLPVVALLVVAAVGLAAGRGARTDAHNLVGIEPGSLQFRVLTAGFLVLAVSAPIAVSRAARYRRRPEPGDVQRLPIPPALLIAMGLGLLLMVGVVVYTLLTGGGEPYRRGAGTGGTAPGSRQPLPEPPRWMVLVGALLVVAVAVAVALLLRPRADRAPVRGVDAPPEPGALRAAAHAGRVALDTADDPRGAVLACYRAMERSLAAGAGAPADADTPAEVVRRAADAGLLRADGAGADLVALFGEARYSAHPVDRHATAAARRALDGVLAELDRHRGDRHDGDRHDGDRHDGDWQESGRHGGDARGGTASGGAPGGGTPGAAGATPHDPSGQR